MDTPERGPFTPSGKKWVLQADGKPYWPDDPSPEVVSIDVIAQSLSQKVRFGGQGWPFYSVAQHSIFVSKLLDWELQPQVEMGIASPYYRWATVRAGLAHDFHEAWLVDLPSPFKQMEWLREEWLALEEKWDEAIFAALGIEMSSHIRKSVKEMDRVAMRLEGLYIMPETPNNWEWPGHGSSTPHVMELSEKYANHFQSFVGSTYSGLRAEEYFAYWRDELVSYWEKVSGRPEPTDDLA